MEVAIIGSGNIASHLAKFFHRNGHRVVQVYNRTVDSGQALADSVSAQFITSLQDLSAVDLVIIAVSDDVIAEIAEQISPTHEAIIVHTSGATNIKALSRFQRYGVIYPPQSINKHIENQRLADIPFAIEGATDETTNILLTTMQAMAPKSFVCNSEQRLALHVGAVFVNNFSNALYQMAYEILKQKGLDFELLRPLLLETAQKVQNNLPKAVQTGPAARNDNNTINAHLQFLRDNEALTEIYQQLTSFIVKSSPKP